MTFVLSAASPALWYLTRGSGAVTLVLLTASVLFGILEIQRWSVRGVPRFMVASVHRSTSLLVLVLVAVHVGTAVLDTFAPIRLLDAVLPFTGAYRPLWLGLGALALDLLLALVLTSLLRRRLGLRAWRGVHWAAYACWPVAVVHGLGTGSDASATWMLALTAACSTGVVAGVGWRLARVWPAHRVASTTGAVALFAMTAAVAVWAPQGPLAQGWARRAGTPSRLLAPSRASAVIRPVVRRSAPDALAAGFSGPLHGTQRQGFSRGGMAVVDLKLRAGGVTMRIRLGGRAAQEGGLRMDRSAVELGTAGHPRRYRGRVTQLDGQGLRALAAAPDGRALDVALALRLNGSLVTGSADARPSVESAG